MFDRFKFYLRRLLDLQKITDTNDKMHGISHLKTCKVSSIYEGLKKDILEVFSLW
jgi:hypothetical protein